MNIGTDRREIALLLAEHFPSMPYTATSDEWHGFLDAKTGLTTALDEPNASAFDRWRMALADQGYPVWGHSAEKIAAIKARGMELQAAEAKRMAELPETLAELAKTAPLVTAAELLKP